MAGGAGDTADLKAQRTSLGRLNTRLETQQTPLATLAFLLERLRTLKRRDPSDLTARREALEGRGKAERSDIPARVEALEQLRQVVPWLQRSLTEGQRSSTRG